LIPQAVERAALFLPVISEHALRGEGAKRIPGGAERRYLFYEWNLAQRLYEQTPGTREYIVPVAIDGTRESDPDLARLRGFQGQWTRLRPGDHDAIRQFATKVRDLIRSRQTA
jgi:hypothetical protein